MPESGGDFRQPQLFQDPKAMHARAMMRDQGFGVGGINTWGVDTNQLHATLRDRIHECGAHRAILWVEGVGVRMGLGPHQQAWGKIAFGQDGSGHRTITGGINDQSGAVAQ